MWRRNVAKICRAINFLRLGTTTTVFGFLYFGDVDLHFDADWSAVVYYWVLSAGFAILAFFAFRLQDGMTRYFSVHEALDIVEAVLFAELMTFAVLFTLTRLDGIPRSIPLVHG